MSEQSPSRELSTEDAEKLAKVCRYRKLASIVCLFLGLLFLALALWFECLPWLHAVVGVVLLALGGYGKMVEDPPNPVIPPP